MIRRESRGSVRSGELHPETTSLRAKHCDEIVS